MTIEALTILIELATFAQTTGKLSLEEASKTYTAVEEAKAEILKITSKKNLKS